VGTRAAQDNVAPAEIAAPPAASALLQLRK
jgi:hypothetical protein